MSNAALARITASAHRRIIAPAADVKAHSHNVQVQLLGFGEQPRHNLEDSPELEAQAEDTFLLSSGIREDDARRIHAQGEDLRELPVRRAVEARAQCRQEPKCCLPTQMADKEYLFSIRLLSIRQVGGVHDTVSEMSRCMSVEEMRQRLENIVLERQSRSPIRRKVNGSRGRPSLHGQRYDIAAANEARGLRSTGQGEPGPSRRERERGRERLTRTTAATARAEGDEGSSRGMNRIGAPEVQNIYGLIGDVKTVRDVETIGKLGDASAHGRGGEGRERAAVRRGGGGKDGAYGCVQVWFVDRPKGHVFSRVDTRLPLDNFESKVNSLSSKKLGRLK
ncbi:hypothetical protein FB451DRAFT_1175000 [Mycena latifolia]|nr:hypothetical protein FB451DRAFT_1175000 [Mycena latifolia]